MADAVAITIVFWFWQHQNPLCCGIGHGCGPLFKTPVVSFVFLIFRDACEGLIAKLFSLIIIVIEDRRGSNGRIQLCYCFGNIRNHYVVA